MYSYMYIVALCVCLLLMYQLTCVAVEKARRVLQAYRCQASYVLSTDIDTYVLTVYSLLPVQ